MVEGARGGKVLCPNQRLCLEGAAPLEGGVLLAVLGVPGKFNVGCSVTTCSRMSVYRCTNAHKYLHLLDVCSLVNGSSPDSVP